MEWKEISIDCSEDGIEAVSNMLVMLGLPGFEIEDERDFNEFLENSHQYWDYVDDELLEKKRGVCRIKVYVTANEAGMQQLEEIRLGLKALPMLHEGKNLGSLRITTESLEEEDWANAWKQYYKPFPVGSRLLVRPEWEECDNPEGRIVFVNNPGMAFGSGSHATTYLCMEQLDARISGGERVYDLGCGSGILSIIAALLGAEQVVGIDIDPNAADIAARNAARNGVAAERCSFFAGNVLTDQALIDRLSGQKADLVVANIVADVIIALCDIVPSLLREGGIFMTSGIIDTRLDEVKAALAKRFEILEVCLQDGWCCIIAKNH